jgi:hypothetical protein
MNQAIYPEFARALSVAHAPLASGTSMAADASFHLAFDWQFLAIR